MTAERPTWQLDWPAAPGRVGRAVLKADPSTFFVDEDLGLAGFPEQVRDVDSVVSGEGEHLCFRLEKVGDNTDYIARQLQRLAGCRDQDIGFCGLKDRHAVTRQWFSVHRPGREADDPAFLAEVSAHWKLLAAHRYVKKLRRGDHRGNVFEITLLEVDGKRENIDAALMVVAKQGCPNYFGGQRFGRDGGNLEQAIRLDPKRYQRGRRKGRDRHRQGLYLSAARSWLFNQVLGRRVEQGNWQTPLPGEPVSGSVTGPLWGDGGTTASDQQEQLERSVVAEHPEMEQVFSDTRMKPERRDLILQPGQFSWQWQGTDKLTLHFELAPGQYATTLIGSVFELNDSGAASGLAEGT
ncbi:MAG: tRNA pseudouridine(13) synthase TruD [Marinobacter sp.]|nr:tRNA pseudouridine(13) synthase TruD [Marinobacter sp.]